MGLSAGVQAMSSRRLGEGKHDQTAIPLNGGLLLGQTPIRDETLWTEANTDRPFVGWRYGPSVEVVLRPTHYLNIISNYQHALFFDEFNGELIGTQPLLRTRAKLFMSRNLNWRFINQWTPYDQKLTNDLLLSYHPMPGTLFFAGYRQTDILDGTAPVERALFLKYSVLFSY